MRRPDGSPIFFALAAFVAAFSLLACSKSQKPPVSPAEQRAAGGPIEISLSDTIAELVDKTAR
ncbi:MAG: hypothetical protein ACXWFJ_03885, partial [Candidatus Aminicenantales bacterium]